MRIISFIRTRCLSQLVVVRIATRRLLSDTAHRPRRLAMLCSVSQYEEFRNMIYWISNDVFRFLHYSQYSVITLTILSRGYKVKDFPNLFYHTGLWFYSFVMAINLRVTVIISCGVIFGHLHAWQLKWPKSSSRQSLITRSYHCLLGSPAVPLCLHVCHYLVHYRIATVWQISL